MTNREKALKANMKVCPQLKGIEVNRRMKERHPHGDEFALLRKEIVRLYSLTKKKPSDEFLAYNEEAEKFKAEVTDEG